ncbi:cyclic nucleotide-gated cation channel beta-1-like [Sceloporus undulatus]|uniref:cyclic nucleotide-gated cation channel beta-1-like n=1 Tax=Sceloporus undulatus TaxID=8520 RepID=UPI001C4D3A88|nr:cyclic nucleotide-gated cation channel beta-1-like [Sceloporus undulatus]
MHHPKQRPTSATRDLQGSHPGISPSHGSLALLPGGRMLGWIEKVVPQPPASSPIRVIVEKEVQAAAACEEAKARLARQLPEAQPGYLTEGLGKVIPQPVGQSTPVKLQAVAKSFEASVDIPDVTEVQSIKYEDEDEIEVTDLDAEEDEEHSELQSSSDNNTPDKIGGKKVLTWLVEGFGKMMPQPENMRKTEEGVSEGRDAEQAICKDRSRGTPGKGTSSPSASGPQHRTPTGSQSNLSLSLFPRSLGGDGISVFEWLVQGLERVMPQPVPKATQDGQRIEDAEMGSGQARSKGA